MRKKSMLLLALCLVQVLLLVLNPSARASTDEDEGVQTMDSAVDIDQDTTMVPDSSDRLQMSDYTVVGTAISYDVSRVQEANASSAADSGGMSSSANSLPASQAGYLEKSNETDGGRAHVNSSGGEVAVARAETATSATSPTWAIALVPIGCVGVGVLAQSLRKRGGSKKRFPESEAEEHEVSEDKDIPPIGPVWNLKRYKYARAYS